MQGEVPRKAVVRPKMCLTHQSSWWVQDCRLIARLRVYFDLAISWIEGCGVWFDYSFCGSLEWWQKHHSEEATKHQSRKSSTDFEHYCSLVPSFACLWANNQSGHGQTADRCSPLECIRRPYAMDGICFILHQGARSWNPSIWQRRATPTLLTIPAEPSANPCDD